MQARAYQAGDKVWFSLAELADMNLPGLSDKRNRMVEIAARQSWADRHEPATGEPLARARKGRGGGLEYHVDCLPLEARLSLVKADTEVTLTAPKSGTWEWYRAQSSRTKADAETRLRAVRAFQACHAEGLSKSAAVAQTAREYGISNATLWQWLDLVKGVATSDWLPALAPVRKGGGVKADIDPEVLTYFKSWYLRPSPVGFEQAMRETLAYAKREGLALPHCTKTLTRRLRAEVPPEVIILRRKGMDALIAAMPAQKRTRAGLVAMEAVNADGHKWDVFVRFPAKNGMPERIGRAITIVIQDLYSNKILAWRTGAAESAYLVQMTFADLFRNYGIPAKATLDNGCAFASKQNTGGAVSRHRFKIKDDEPDGLLTMAGVTVHWATPGHGQAKPIERSFRDMTAKVAMHPICQGAYTGHRPTAKPDDYGTKAVDLATLESLIADKVAEFNAQTKRRTENAAGRSFDETFAASAAENPITQASAEQLGIMLLTAENVRASKKTAEVSIYGNAYHAPELLPFAGDRVTVRFDPDNLHSNVEVYQTSGPFICSAPVRAAVGFYDQEGAKARAKQVGNVKKAARELDKATALLSAAELASKSLPDLAAASKPVRPPRPKIARLMRSGGSGSGLAAVAADPAQVAFHDRFAAAVAGLEAADARRKFTVFDGGLTPHREPERPQK